MMSNLIIKSYSSFLLCSWMALAGGRALAQNVVEGGAGGAVSPPIHLTDSHVEDFLSRAPEFASSLSTEEKRRIASKLNRHVVEFLDGFPWRPFHVTLGISGYENYFDHPDEQFLAMSLALPHFPPETAQRVNTLLKLQLAERPPYREEGYDRAAGSAREHYDVPESLRIKGRSSARSALGVYAFWIYCRAARDEDSAREHWPAVCDRMRPLLSGDYPFDPDRRDYSRDEAEKLNGDLAGLLGLWRLAREVGDAQTESAAKKSATKLLELRVNLERVNPAFLEKTRTSNRSLHLVKPARYCSLVPEVAEAVRRYSEGLAAARLKALREERNGWWMAFGDRLIGGENYTSPPDFSRALFSGAAFIEQLPADHLARFIDIPWGRGDLYYIEKCAITLDAFPAIPSR